MSREAHVRFDGSGEGQFLPATLLETANDDSETGESHSPRDEGAPAGRVAVGQEAAWWLS